MNKRRCTTSMTTSVVCLMTQTIVSAGYYYSLLHSSISATRRPHLHPIHRIRKSISNGITASFSENENEKTSTSSSLTKQQQQLLHQKICLSDPQWYKEYVIDMLGEEYCIAQWSIDTPSVSSISTVTPIVTTSTLNSVQPIPSSFTSNYSSIPSKSSMKLSSKQYIISTNSQSRAIPNTMEWKLDSETAAPKGTNPQSTTRNDNTLSSPTITNDQKQTKKDSVESLLPLELDEDNKKQENKDISNLKAISQLDDEHRTSNLIKNTMVPNETSRFETFASSPPSQSKKQRIKTSLLQTPTVDDDDDDETDSDSKKVTKNATLSTNYNNVEDDTKMKDVVRNVSTTTTTTMQSTNNKKDDHEDDDDHSNTELSNNNNVDSQPMVVYRNIVGNALTYIPLQNLTHLGYTVPELVKMQSESLSVVIMDQIPNPKMGVPMQWCVVPHQSSSSSSSSAAATQQPQPQQVQVVDTIQQALQLIQEDQKIQQRERIRQRENQKVQPSIKVNNTKRQVAEINSESIASQQQDSNPRDNQPPTPKSSSKWKSSNKSLFENDSYSSRNGVTTKPLSQRKNDPRSSSSSSMNRNSNESTKRIYNARRNPYYGNNQVIAKTTTKPLEDRNNDPPVPIQGWVDYNTFKELLRKEAKFRLNILGDRFTPYLKQESNWRLDLYKAWLWKLHDGIGESFVPPSRYERARRLQKRQRGLYSRSLNNDNRRSEILRDRARPRQREKSASNGILRSNKSPAPPQRR